MGGLAVVGGIEGAEQGHVEYTLTRAGWQAHRAPAA
jgi:hypothetical protein